MSNSVVGGGTGLSGAVTLARARRTVAVIDARHPRNAPVEAGSAINFDMIEAETARAVAERRRASAR